MEDLLKRYGGIANLKKHLNFFYKKVCEEKKIKHYFFGINVDNVINDVVNYRSFILRKPDHLYRDYPAFRCKRTNGNTNRKYVPLIG